MGKLSTTEGDGMELSRYWAMPDKNTFSIKPIAEFVDKYCQNRPITIDPFARDFALPTYTNDLNPGTLAEYHLKAVDFLKMLNDKNIKADLVFFDPPYSNRQVKECYENIGIKMEYEDTLNGHWGLEKDLISNLVDVGGVVLSFGWNTIGMGIKRGFEIVEIMLVCHGGAHNDTICLAEKKIREQREFEF